jgi:N-acetylmuramoyl-L-alanine amidase
VAPAQPEGDRRAHGADPDRGRRLQHLRPRQPRPRARRAAQRLLAPAGKIFRLVNLRTRCRHTVGRNWTSIGIEHAGYGDEDLLGDRRQLRASLRLTQYLRCRFEIGVRNVIGHAESLSSPFHYERVPSLRTQTHGDMQASSMQVYRQKLRGLGRC